ncbi:ADP-ribosyltransferase, partial [Actinomadura kijaniata]|uniref:ADP-ribosyltransferase n=1 Tax=Actinomadura kijaniata TaxID=46161 RepID=UPI0031D831FC
MGLEIPDSVKWLSWIVGSDWPEGDETAMRRAAQAWYDAGVELDELIEELRRTTDEVLSVLEGAGADEFRWYFEQWLSVDPQHLPNLRKGCDSYGRMLDQGALDIEYAKYMFIATLIITAIEIIWLIANAIHTFGGSLAGIPIVQALAQLSARLIGRALLRAIAMGVAMGIAEGLGLDLLIQAIQAIKGDRTEWDSKKTRGAVIDGAIGGALSGGLGHGFGKIPGLSGPGGSALGGFAKGAVREGASEALAGVGSTVISAGMNGEDLSWKDIAKGATSGAAGGAVGGGTDGIKGYRASTAGGDGGGPGDGNGSNGGDNSGDNSSNNGSGNNSGPNDSSRSGNGSGSGDSSGSGNNSGSGNSSGTGNGPSGGDSTSGSQTSNHGGDGSSSGSNGSQNSSGGSGDGSTNTSSNGSSTNTSSNSPDSGPGNGSNTNTSSPQTSSNDGSGNTPGNSGGDNSGTGKGDGGNSHNPGDTNRISNLLGNGGNDGAAPSLASTNNGDGASHSPASHTPAPSTPAPAPASVPSPGDGGSPNSPSNSSSSSNQQASNLSSAPSTTPSGPATTPSSTPVGGAPASTPPSNAPSSGTSSPGPVPAGVPSGPAPRGGGNRPSGGAPRTNTEAPSRPETTRSPVDKAPPGEHRPRADKQDAPSDTRPRERSGSDNAPDRRSPANEQPSPPQKAPERFPTDKQDAPSDSGPRERSGSEKVPVGASSGAAPRGEADDAPTRSEPDPTDNGADDSSPVPEGLPENLRDVWRNSEETPAGRSLHTDPQMRDLARRVPADPNRYVLDGHGNPDGMRSGGRHLTVDEVADLIRNDPNWNGREVMLISCRTGDGDFARQLAQRLGVPVTAPHGKAWTDDNGSVYSSSTTTDAGNSPQPTWPPDGGWTTHRPDGTRTPSGRDGFAPGHPRPDAPNTDGDGGRRADDPASNDRTPSRNGDSTPGREENAPPRRDDTPSPQDDDRRQPDSPDRAPENGNPRERADEDADGQTGKPKDSPELTAKKQEQLRTQTLGDVNDPTSADPTTPLSEHYHLNDGSAHRNNVNDGHPHLQWNKDTGRWEPATNRPLVIADHIKPKLPKVRSDDAQRQQHERLMERRRDAINEVARAEKEYTGDPTPENKKVRTDAFTAQRNLGERLGERAADQAFDDLIRDRFGDGNPEIERLYPFNDPFDVPDEHVGTQSESPGRGEYDRVYKVTVDGHTHYFVVEAKGPTAPLGKREIDDVDYQQGHPKYFRDILKVMIEKGGEDKKVALEILNALNGRTPDSSVEYHVVRALIDDGTTGQGRIAAGEKEDPGDPHSKHKHIGTRENPVYGGYDRQQFDLDSRRDYDRAAKRFVDGTENPSPDPRSRSADDTPSRPPQEPPSGAMARGTDDDAPPPRDDRSPDQRARDAEERIARDAVTFPDRDSAYDYGARHWNESAENLPQDQKDAVRNYTDEPPADHPTYKEINGALRDGTTPSPEVQRHIDALDRALNAHPTPEPIVVTRGTSLSYLNMPPESMVGHTFQDPGFLSTSLGPPAGAAAFKNAVIHMRVPEGTPALWVEKLSEMGAGERELILPRGLKFRVDEVVRIDGKWQVYASVVPADTPVTASTDRAPATAPAPTPTPPTPNPPFAAPPATGPSSPPTPWTAPTPSPSPHPATADATPTPVPPATPSWANPAPATPPNPNAPFATPPAPGATPSSTPPATPPWAPAAPPAPAPNGTPPNPPAPNPPFAAPPATGPSS